MLKKNRLATAVASVIGSSLVLGLTAPGALAQQDQLVLEEVVVTGSRIARKDFIANSPVQTISNEDVELRNSLNVENLLNQMPQVQGSFGSTNVINGEAVATVDLRGLGTERTLVLVDGRRLVPYDQGNSVDVSMIPGPLIDSVEIMTGGASAVYGSDALAGVVNFKLKRDFEGFQINTSYEDTDESDRKLWQVNLLFGSSLNDGRGNATFFAGYSDREEVGCGDRDACNRSAYGDTFTGSGIQLWGSSRIPETRIDDPALFPGGADAVSFTPDGNAIPLSDVGPFDYARYQTLATPEERYNVSFMTHYTFSDQVTFYGDAHYKSHKSSFFLAPTPAELKFFDFDFARNPFITDATKDLFAASYDTGTGLDKQAGDGVATFSKVRRRTLENGSRFNDNEFTTLQLVLGFRGDLTDNWNYDTYVNYGDTNWDETISGDASDRRMRNGLNAALDETGTARCISQLNPDGTYNPFADTSCVPGSIWGEGSMSDEFVDYVTANTTRKREREQWTAAFGVTGTLWELPAGELGVAFGYEHREEKAQDNPDSAIVAGDVLGFNAAGATASSSYDVDELYVEALVPLLSGIPFANYLGLEVGYRYSDYSTIGSTDTYKFGGEWAPTQSLRFRAMFQRAVRAPNLEDLYNGFIQSNPFFTDPCNSDTASPDLQAFCVQTGIPAELISTYTQSDTQFEEIRRANPDLSEESSDTYTVGFVWEPEFLEGLALTVDYYDIEIDDAISVLGGDAATLLDNCYAGRDLNSTACQAVSRNPATGDVNIVNTSFANLSQMNAKGVDFTAQYQWDTSGLGIAGDGATWTIGVVGNYTDELSFIPEAGASKVECVGTFGNFGCVPGQADGHSVHEWQTNSYFRYTSGPLLVNLDWVWLDEVENHPDNGGDELTIRDISSYDYFDLQARYTWNNLEVFAAVDNLTDEDPPFLGVWWASNSGTDVYNYDTLGRRYRIGMTYNF